MPRIYDQSQNSFQSQYQRSAQSRGFNPVQAADNTAKIKENNQRILNDLQYQDRSAQRQEKLDRDNLKLTADAELAKSKANGALIEGLMGLSQTVANEIGKATEEGIAKQKKQEQLDAASSWINGGGTVVDTNDKGGVSVVSNPDETDAGKTAAAGNADIDSQVTAIETGVVDATSDPETQERLRGESADTQAQGNKEKVNVYQAATDIWGVLGDFLDSDTLVQLPDGRVIAANAAANRQELTAVAQAAIKDYAATNGLTGSGPGQQAFVDVFLPAAQNALAREVSARAAGVRDASQNQRIEAANEAAFGGLKAGGSVQDAWTTLSDSYFGSGKFKGDRTKANDAAITELLNYLIQTGNVEGIKQLGDTAKFTDANGKAGPKLSTTYAVELAKAERDARSVRSGDRRTANAEAKESLQEANNSFIEALTTATTPEEVEAAHTAYEATLKGLNTPEAREEWLKQKNIPNTRNPLAYGALIDRIASGETLSSAEINEAISSGLISVTQGRELTAMNGAGLEAQTAALKPVQPTVKAIATAAANGALKAAGVPTEALKPASVALAADITTRLNSYLGGLLKSDPEMTTGQLTEAAQNWVNQNGRQLLDGVEWNKETYSVDGYTYAGTTSTEKATAKKYTNPVTGKQGVVLTGLSVEQMSRLQFDQNLDNDIDPSNDRVLRSEEMADSLTAIINGDIDAIPARVKAIADLLDVTPQYLIAEQAKAQGLPNAAEVGRAVTYNPDNPNLTSVEQQALDVIGKYESDGAGSYNAVNQGGSDGGNTVLGYSGHYAKLGGTDLTDLSIAEIMELQREDGRSWDSWFASGKLHAVGRYQFIGSTLANIVRAMGIDGSSKFTPELQDQMALWLLRNAGNGIGQWVGPDNYATASERDVVNQARNNVIAANRILRNPRRTEAQTRRAVRDISTAGGLFA